MNEENSKKLPEVSDATAFILKMVAKKSTGHSCIYLDSDTVYNIDDMDPRAYMQERRMSGCYTVISSAMINPEYPGEVWIDGEYAGDAVIGNKDVIQTIGFFVRKKFTEYGKTYHIKYCHAVADNGYELEPFEIDITTLPKKYPGEKYPEHDLLVLQAAREGAVLLKNHRQALPLGKNNVVNIFGKGGPAYRLGCVGAGKINPRYGIRLEEGIDKYTTLKLNHELFDFYRDEKDIMPDADMLQRAKTQNDTAVIVITRGTGESIDNTPTAGSYYLTEEEKNLLKNVSEAFSKTVVLLNTGFPIEMGWEEKYRIDAVLWTGLNGMAGGQAVAEILEGTTCPSGKLPDTWAMDYYDYPSSLNFCLPTPDVMQDRFNKMRYAVNVYEEDMYVGYRYFNTFHKKAAYNFGHGLSYTKFSKEVLLFNQNGAHVHLKIRVTNTGCVAGKEAVLIYAHISDGRIEQPERRLVAFSKTHTLASHEIEVLTFDIPAKRFESYDELNAIWTIEEGTITLYAGDDVDLAEKIAEFNVDEQIVLQYVENRVYPPFNFRGMSKMDIENTWPKGEMSHYYVSETVPFERKRKNFEATNDEAQQGNESLITFPMLIENPKLIDAFIAQLSDYDLARMSVGGRTGWGVDDNGFAGTLYTEGKLEKYKLPEYYFADGNNGLNMFEANIGFPVSNVLGATFNMQLSYEEGKAIAREAKDMNLQCILAPAMNLHRNILCGRHSEYFSEDPLLAGCMGGMESKGLEDGGVSSCMKHFFANNAETIRQCSHSIMSERAARELYLKVFEIALEINEADAFMTGYNLANGAYCAGDSELLIGILRKEWGYSGYVMTDWGSSNNCDVVQIIGSGNSWIAPGEMDDSEVLPLVEAMQDGILERARVRKNVKDMYTSILKHYIMM